MFKFNKIIYISLLLCAGSLSINTQAATTPSSYNDDERIRYLQYNPNAVYVINTNLNVSTLIQLEKGEHIDGLNTGVGMGDATAWSLAIKGSNIFLKPNVQLSDTNMIIVTNKRTYALQLVIRNDHPSYIVRFVYPDIVVDDETQPLPNTLLKSMGKDANGNDILITELINTDYSKRGDDSIMPMRVWDDGLFTFFKHPNSKDIPVIYKVLPDGSETLVNSHVEGDTIVVHGTNQIYRLRFGNLVGEISNNSPNYDGYFNNTGTSDKSLTRGVQ